MLISTSRESCESSIFAPALNKSTEITALAPLGELSERAQRARDTKGKCVSCNKRFLHRKTSVTAIDLSYVCWFVLFKSAVPWPVLCDPQFLHFFCFFSTRGWGIVQLSAAFAAFLHFAAPGRQPSFLSCKENKGSRNKYLFPCFTP